MPVKFLEDYDIGVLERYWFKRNELEDEAKQLKNGEQYVNERLKLVNAMKDIYENESEEYRTLIDMYFVEEATRRYCGRAGEKTQSDITDEKVFIRTLC